MATLMLNEGIDSWFCIFYICILLVIAFLALLFNTIVLATIYSSTELRRPFDLYIANLAVSDIVLVFSSTFTIDNAKMQWNMGEGLCKGCFYGVYLSYTVTTLTLCAMSIERYHGICKPLQYAAMTPFQKCRVSIPALWLISALIASPSIFAYGVQDFTVSGTNNYQHMCEENWSIVGQRVYSVIFLVLLFFAPVVLLVFALARIIDKLNIPLSATSGGNVILHKKRMRTAQLLLLMIAVHLLCWAPSLFFKVVKSFSGTSSVSLSLWLGFELVHFGRSLIYPLIYVGMHTSFRSALKALYQACSPCKSNQNNSSSTTGRVGSAPGSSVASDRSAFYFPEDELTTDM